MKHMRAEVMMPIDILRLHTLRTAQVLKIDNAVGSLEPGKYADFLIIDPSSTGAVFDPVATLVFACSSSDIESVYVAGEALVQEGKVKGHDMDAIQTDLVSRIDRIRKAAISAGKEHAM